MPASQTSSLCEDRLKHPRVHLERIGWEKAERINDILNHPHVRPWVADVGEGVLDITDRLRNENNVCLVGTFGGVVLFKILPGIYEAHTQVVPEGRGAWTRTMISEVANWIFTNTDAVEVLTRVPVGHIAAHAAAIAAGFTKEFRRDDCCTFRGKSVQVDIFRLSIQEWIAKAPHLEERGAWLHERMNAEAKRLGITAPPHEEDANHNQYVGACVDMAFAGQVYKAIGFYNRWAIVSRHAPIEFVSADPLMVKFDAGVLKFVNGNDVEIIP